MADGNKKKKYIVFLLQLVAAAVLALVDQLIKKAAVTSLKGQDGIVLIKNVLGLTYAENTGAAFSLFSEHPQMVMMLTALLLLFLTAVVFRRLRLTTPARLAVSALLGGGLGNLADRLFFGAVTDYIRLLFIRFPVFNLADVLITLSVATLMLLLFTGRLEVPSGETHE